MLKHRLRQTRERWNASNIDTDKQLFMQELAVIALLTFAFVVELAGISHCFLLLVFITLMTLVVSIALPKAAVAMIPSAMPVIFIVTLPVHAPATCLLGVIVVMVMLRRELGWILMTESRALWVPLLSKLG